MVSEPAELWSVLSPEGSESIFLRSSDPCLSCASFTRPTQIGASGRWPMPDPMNSRISGA
jgi:hypothetical protein